MMMQARRPQAAAAAAWRPAQPTRAVQVANVVIFQAAWLAAVLGAANEAPLAGTLCIVAALMWHLAVSARPAREARLIALACLLGVAVEGVGCGLGYVAYAAGQPLPSWPPYWLIALWGLLAMSLNVTLRWLRGRWRLAAALGALAGPLSFVSGVRLGAGRFVDRPAALVELAVVWAIALPLLVWLSVRFDGVSADPP